MKKLGLVLAVLLLVGAVYAQPTLSSTGYVGLGLADSEYFTDSGLQMDAIKVGISLDFTYQFDFGLSVGAEALGAFGFGNFVYTGEFMDSDSINAETPPFFTGDFRIAPVVGYAYNPGGKSPKFPMVLVSPVFFATDFGLGRITDTSSTYMGSTFEFIWVTMDRKNINGSGFFIGCDIFWQQTLTDDTTEIEYDADFLGVDINVGYRFIRAFK